MENPHYDKAKKHQNDQEANLEEKSSKTNFLLRLIQKHYTYKKSVKPDDQIQREKWLIPNILLFNRWMTLPAAVIVQFCIGSLFSWSVFNKPIDTLIYGEGSKISAAPVAFHISCGLLGFSSAVMGPWLERHGPRTSCLVGTFLYCFGHFVTALALHYKQIWLVIVSYGIISGFGSGLCYISPISTLQKWFPDKRGFASGSAVCGFAAGSIVLAKVQIPLMNTFGLPLTFIVLGGIYLIVMTLGALVLRTPPPDFSVHGMRSDRSIVRKNSVEKNKDNDEEKEVGLLSEKEKQQNNPNSNPIDEDHSRQVIEDSTLVEALLSKDYRLMYMMFFGSVVYGLCTISRLSNIVTDIFGRSPEEASTVVAVNGGFNLAGRLMFPIISDFFGRKGCFLFMLTVQLLIIAAFSTLANNRAYTAFVVTTWILTACYGGASGTMPAFITDRFGPKNMGACHGVIMTAWSLSGFVGGFVSTAIYDYLLSLGYSTTDAYPYNVNSWWMCFVALLGWISLVCVSPTDKDIKFRGRVRGLCNNALCK